MVLKGNCVNGGKAEGEAIVIKTPFSFLGELNADTGKIASPFHEQFGQSIKNKVLVIPTGKGSSMGPIIGWYAMKANNHPSAIVCVEAESIIASVAITSNIPMVDKLDKNPLDVIKSGDYVKVDATAGIVEIVGK
jgi:predicted aconitase with swiveling domain